MITPNNKLIFDRKMNQAEKEVGNETIVYISQFLSSFWKHKPMQT